MYTVSIKREEHKFLEANLVKSQKYMHSLLGGSMLVSCRLFTNSGKCTELYTKFKTNHGSENNIVNKIQVMLPCSIRLLTYQYLKELRQTRKTPIFGKQTFVEVYKVQLGNTDN